jgi:hypothetical protein
MRITQETRAKEKPASGINGEGVGHKTFLYSKTTAGGSGN